MAQPQTITVYNYRMLDRGRETVAPEPAKATREHIAALRYAQLLEGTAEEVPLTALDRQGLYRRVATGWGEL